MALAMEMPKKSLTSTRGFASMDRETQLAIARKGGASVPNEKRSFAQNRGYDERIEVLSPALGSPGPSVTAG